MLNPSLTKLTLSAATMAEILMTDAIIIEPKIIQELPAYTLAIAIEFLGTNYHGWQRQKEVTGVQEALETAISKVANESVEVIAAGRTRFKPA